MKKAAIWIGVIIGIILISFFFGAYLGDRYKSDYTKEASKKMDIKKVMQNKESESNSSKVKESKKENNSNNNTNTQTKSTDTNTGNETTQNNTQTSTNNTNTNQSEDESKTVYRIIVDGQQKVALTGKQKAIDYAKKNFKGNVVIQSSKTNETVAEFKVQ